MIELNEEQQQAIIKEWNKRPNDPPSLIELVNLAWGPGFDGRSKQGAAVKKFLAEKSLKARPAQDYKAKGFLELTPVQKKFIESHCENSGPVEIARDLFGIPNLANVSQEVRSVIDYLRQIEKLRPCDEGPQEAEGDYKAPFSDERMMIRINKYVDGAIDRTNITSKNKKDIKALIRFMGNYRFTSQINSFRMIHDRELFESTFIRCCWDKADLTEEETDQYIIYATEVVMAQNITKRIDQFEREQDRSIDENNGKMSMTLVEAIGSLRNEYNQCVGRQNKLLEALKGKRSERLNSQIKENASILNLVTLWKEEDSRQKLIKMAEKHKEEVKKGWDELMTMDQVKAQIFGLTEGEILDG